MLPRLRLASCPLVLAVGCSSNPATSITRWILRPIPNGPRMVRSTHRDGRPARLDARFSSSRLAGYSKDYILHVRADCTRVEV